MRSKGPTAAEVDRARNVLETQVFNGLQLVGGFGGVADQLKGQMPLAFAVGAGGAKDRW